MKIDAKYIATLNPKPGDVLVFETTSTANLQNTSRALGKLMPEGVKVIVVRQLKLLRAQDLAQLSMLIENAQIREEVARQSPAPVGSANGTRRKRNPGDGQ